MSLGTCRLYNDRQASSPLDPAPHAVIEYRKAVIYPAPRVGDRLKRPCDRSLSNLTRGVFNGYISPATRRQIKRTASTWLRSIFIYREHLKPRHRSGDPYPVFLTLTLPVPQEHDDRVINRQIFTPFLQRLKREHGIQHYMWRAEAQQNGNLHYHVIIDRYVPAERLQDLWNLSIDALDYRWKYAVSTGSIIPPTTEVHAIRPVIKDRKTGREIEVDPVDYLVDYFTEVPQERAAGPGTGDPSPASRVFVGRYRQADGKVIEYRTRGIAGRCWGMSDRMRDLRPPRAIVTHRLQSILEDAVDRGELRRIDRDHATLYFGPVHRILQRHHKPAARLINRHYLHCLEHMYPGTLPAIFTTRHRPQDPSPLWIDLTTFTTYATVIIDGTQVIQPSTQRARSIQLHHEAYAA